MLFSTLLCFLVLNIIFFSFFFLCLQTASFASGIGIDVAQEPITTQNGLTGPWTQFACSKIFLDFCKFLYFLECDTKTLDKDIRALLESHIDVCSISEIIAVIEKDVTFDHMCPCASQFNQQHLHEIETSENFNCRIPKINMSVHEVITKCNEGLVRIWLFFLFL